MYIVLFGASRFDGKEWVRSDTGQLLNLLLARLLGMLGPRKYRDTTKQLLYPTQNHSQKLSQTARNKQH